MKIAFSWLKEYLDSEITINQASALLTSSGLEVESSETFESVKGGLKGVVVGEVKSVIKHPNADKLSVTQVDLGNGDIHQIVCGAPNVAEGQKVLVATTGCTLYPSDGESFEIKKSKIRGEVSDGMICAEDELGLGKSHEGIMVLPVDAVPGTPAADFLKLESETVFEIGLTPNRVDAASHIGCARDLVAALNSRSDKKSTLRIPSVDVFKAEANSGKIKVTVEDIQACPRYSGITIDGVTVGDSPEWLKKRLDSIGIKPINNIVDVTNFVLHECGQPLHAFDADKIKGNHVIVKKLKQDTPFTTLDGTERKLSAEDLIICNQEEGMCIAGVFGGMHSGIKKETTSVFLESAYFSPQGIRLTSKRHGLKTDAAFRYERGADPDITVYALKRAALLIKEIAGGRISSEVIDVYPEKVKPAVVQFSIDRFTEICGVEIETGLLKGILKDLGITILSENKDSLQLQIPAFKPDVLRDADVFEEVLRIYGYDKIPFGSSIRMSVPSFPKPDRENFKKAISSQLSSQGFYEIISHSLVKSSASETAVRMKNPLSDEMSALRESLIPSGLQVIEYNLNRKNMDLRFFEFGKTYRVISGKEKSAYQLPYIEDNHLALFICGSLKDDFRNRKNTNVDFYYTKGIAENLFTLSGISDYHFEKTNHEMLEECAAVQINNKVAGCVGKVKKQLLKQAGINQAVFYCQLNTDMMLKSSAKNKILYTEVSKFPEVRRDLSMMLDKKVTYQELEKLSFHTDSQMLKKVSLFDVYEGEKIAADKKSYALSFFLQDNHKTLTDKEVESVMDKLAQAFETKLGAVIRKT